MPPLEARINQMPQRKLYCNRCGRTTNHNVRGNYCSVHVDEQGGFEEEEDCSLCECAGCEAPTLLVKYTNSAMGEESQIILYPERQSGWRISKRFVKLPRKLAQTYQETVRAFNRGSLLLSTIGLRVLIEGVCDDKGAKGATLERKIDALSVHFGNQNITSYLHGFRFSGNEAVHRLEPLTGEEISAALTVMEDLLNYLYDLDYKASRMKHAQRGTTIVAAAPTKKTGPQP
jgi:uncharacterized protein DUF4145